MKLRLLPAYKDRQLRRKVSNQKIPCPLWGSAGSSLVFNSPNVNMALVFVGVVPNFASWSSEKDNVSWIWLQPQNHHSHFPPDSLIKLFASEGFSRRNSFRRRPLWRRADSRSFPVREDPLRLQSTEWQ